GQKQVVWNYIGRPAGDSGKISMALIEMAWSSPATLAIAPLQDVLNLGAEARMNVPGRTEGNWGWRVTEDMLAPSRFDRLRDITQVSGRNASNSTDSRNATHSEQILSTVS